MNAMSLRQGGFWWEYYGGGGKKLREAQRSSSRHPWELGLRMGENQRRDVCMHACSAQCIMQCINEL